MIKPLSAHYSMENPATIFDEEAMTALELAGRTAAKVNECVALVNEVPDRVAAEFKKNLDNGVFEKQVNAYAAQAFTEIEEVEKGLQDEMAKTEAKLRAELIDFSQAEVAELSERMNTFAQLPSGSTAADAELMDIRVNSIGYPHPSAGDAVRATHKMVLGYYVATNANLFNPFNILPGLGLTDDNGIGMAENSALSEMIGIYGYTTIYCNDYMRRIQFYDANQNAVTTLSHCYKAPVPDGAKFFRVQFKYDDEIHPMLVDNNWAKYITIAPQWSHAPFYKPFNDLMGRTASSRKGYHHAMFKAGVFPLTFEEMRFGALQQDNINGVTKGVCFTFYGRKRLQTIDPLYIPAGTTLSVPQGYEMTLYEKVNGEYIQRYVNVNAFAASQDCEYYAAIRKSTNTALSFAEGREIFNSIGVEYAPLAIAGGGTVVPFGDFLFSMGLNELTYMSDHTFIGNDLYVINAAADDHKSTAPVTVYGVDFEKKTAYYKRTIQHNLGHANTIDYSPENDCLILGNGSSDASLPGEVMLLYHPGALSAWRYEDCQIIPLAAQNYGYKMQAVWGEHNNEQNNVIYILTNDNRNIRRLILNKNNGRFDGTFVEAGSWTSPVVDVNQGTAFYRGALYTAVGHSSLLGVKRELLPDGNTVHTLMKDPILNADGTENGGIFSEGIAIKNGYLAFGGSDGRIRFYRM